MGLVFGFILFGMCLCGGVGRCNSCQPRMVIGLTCGERCGGVMIVNLWGYLVYGEERGCDRRDRFWVAGCDKLAQCMERWD